MTSLPGSHAAGRRAAANTVLRATGELSGKLGTFVLFAAMTRTLGQDGVGVFVMAFAYVQVMAVFIDQGFDRVVVRRVAVDHGTMPTLLTNVIALKALVAIPVVIGGWALAGLIGYQAEPRTAIYVLTAGLFLDSINRSIAAVLSSHERSGLVAIGVVAQRLTGAVLGIGALAVGFGVVGVSASYGLGSAIGVVVGLTLVVRHLARPARTVAPQFWGSMLRESVPFALLASLGQIQDKVDALALSILSTHAAVGLYGAASRLYEASFFITFSLNGAFMAMYTYLTPTSVPSVGAVLERSLKLALSLLLPLTVAFIVAAEPLCAFLFGDSFRETAPSLRLLAPSIAFMGIASLASTLVSLRTGPRPLMALAATTLTVNVGLNVVLIPVLGAPGAGLAMSTSFFVFASVSLIIASRLVGGVHLVRMTASPVIAAAAMALVMLAVGAFVPSLIAGAATFALIFVLAERKIAPDDLRFAVDVLRRRTPAAPAA